MSESMNENVIEFLRGEKTATLTLAGNTRLNSRVRKIAAERPDECQIVFENEDGSIMVHCPVKWIKVNPSREMTEEQKDALREHMNRIRERK